MKQIFFEEVTIQNFLSVGNHDVKVQFNTGFNIITGSNKDKEDRRNGVGKSTIADAINFAIFGSTLRDLKKELIPNNLTNETCSVILNFKGSSVPCTASLPSQVPVWACIKLAVAIIRIINFFILIYL